MKTGAMMIVDWNHPVLRLPANESRGNLVMRKIVGGRFTCESFLGFLFLLASIALVPTSSMADSIPNRDDRRPQSRVGPGNFYAPIGIVNHYGSIYNDGKEVFGARGTAFLISPCLAMTNYHVVFGSRSSREIEPNAVNLAKKIDSGMSIKKAGESMPPGHNYVMQFMVGENPDGTFKYKVDGYPFAWGEDFYGDGKDWTILQFHDCPGADLDIGWLDLKYVKNIRESNIWTAGYPGFKQPLLTDKMTLYRTDICYVYSELFNLSGFQHDCTTASGQSGSPIFTNSEGKIVVVGLVSRGSRSSEVTYVDPKARDELAVSSVVFLDEALPLIADDIKKYHLNNYNGRLFTGYLLNNTDIPTASRPRFVDAQETFPSMDQSAVSCYYNSMTVYCYSGTNLRGSRKVAQSVCQQSLHACSELWQCEKSGIAAISYKINGSKVYSTSICNSGNDLFNKWQTYKSLREKCQECSVEVWKLR
jgi:V8-like Glu-specific endopeptidase